MSHMNENPQHNTDFINLHNKSYRLVAAVFAISNVMDQDENLRTKIKQLSLDLISLSVNLKDINFMDARKLLGELEKNSLLLTSLINIASVSGLISKMNADIMKEEFQAFISELGKFAERFEHSKNSSVQNIFLESVPLKKTESVAIFRPNTERPSVVENNSNGHKRKGLRRNTILNFIKGHNNVSIKDIVPNIVGCSEKTVQRELIDLINEGKIKKNGERRWSKYSII